MKIFEERASYVNKEINAEALKNDFFNLSAKSKAEALFPHAYPFYSV